MCICKTTSVYTANVISAVLYIVSSRVSSTNTSLVQADVTQQLLDLLGLLRFSSDVSDRIH